MFTRQIGRTRKAPRWPRAHRQPPAPPHYPGNPIGSHGVGLLPINRVILPDRPHGRAPGRRGLGRPSDHRIPCSRIDAWYRGLFVALVRGPKTLAGVLVLMHCRGVEPYGEDAMMARDLIRSARIRRAPQDVRSMLGNRCVHFHLAVQANGGMLCYSKRCARP